jgi:chromosome segregation protein
MRLQSLTLHGFKSFGDRTEIRVLPGITAVVGPNGTGKSNLSDAIRWALGEQSARALRGQRMEDVIFHGSASRKPVGLAEVELVFSNDGTLPVAWSEVSVTRRLYRTGESEYLLNHTPARLRDILDLFAGTGANPRAYSVMDQDKLNHVLTAKPQERRIFIEEAAGIARYRQQRHETEGKLAAARQNLVRVRDVMDEVRRQLGSLERQARKAQQYKALAAERRELALRALALEYQRLEAERARLEGALAARRTEADALRTRLARLAAREAEVREALQASEHGLSDLRQALQKVQAELERLLERREQLGIQLRETEEEATRLDADLAVLTARLTSLGDQREGAGHALEQAEQAVAERRRAAEELALQLAAHRQRLGLEREQLEALRLQQLRLAAERTDLTRAAGEWRERQQQLQRRAARLAAELAEAEAELRELAARRAALEGARAQVLHALASLETEWGRLTALVADRERARAEAEARVGEARVALAARASSLEALRGLERQREGYGSGVRAVFGEAGRTELSGVLGTVADLLEVPADLERAVEAVLGERLEWVVVERFEQARAAVTWLETRQAGTATFIPLDTLPVVQTPTGEHGVRWMVRDVGASVEHLRDYLLGRVVVVDHLDQAEALWRRNGTVATYVTPQGQVLAPTGRLKGGAGPGPGERSPLARKRQLRELEAEVRRLEHGLAGAQAELERAEREVEEARASLAACAGALAERRAARLAHDKDLEQVLREHDRVGRHVEAVRLEARQVASELEEATRGLVEIEGRLGAAQQAETAQEATAAAVRARIEAAQQEEAALAGAYAAAREALASGMERVEALARDLGRLQEMASECQQRLEQGRTRRAQLGERLTWLAEERERTDEAARRVAHERDRAEQEVRAAAERHEALLAALREAEGEARSAQTELGRVEAAAHALELEATERRVRTEELRQEAARAFGADEAVLRSCAGADTDLQELRQRVGELDERLAALGPVNLVADEEYRELDERLSFLGTQHDDLVTSIRDLERALRGMTRTAQERFLEAFHQINRDFGALFERLFEGGRAELRLVEAEEGGDPLETGVELMAQPRGKRLQSVTLLSGGERALTGLALLFAIFYYRPSPFCVLDEVDAPLDDANIHRFLRVLRELTHRTQFLVITHNRRTMEAADILYGVTMEEPGLSKLVSVRLGTEA